MQHEDHDVFPKLFSVPAFLNGFHVRFPYELTPLLHFIGPKSNMRNFARCGMEVSDGFPLGIFGICRY
jgi:hypothetical protein